MADKIFPTQIDNGTPDSADRLLFADVSASNATKDCAISELPVSTATSSAIAVVQADVDAHEARTDNPHSVTKTQVGLGNVDNTSDLSKPVSTDTQSALDLKQDTSEKGQIDGYASLDGTGKVPAAQLPTGIGTGDVLGPATNSDSYIPQWDGADSKTLKNGIPISTFATALGADDNYVTDAEKVIIGNTGGTNTGDVYPTIGFSSATYIVDGTADDVQIQSAIDAAAVSGGTVFIKSGTYNISNNIVLKSNVNILGSGAGTILLCDGVTSGSVFYNSTAPTDVYRITIKDLKITRTTLDTSVYGIDVTAINYSKINNVEITNIGRAIYGNGDGYYNEYYDLNFSGNGYNVYLENSNNEQHFFGGAMKAGTLGMLYISGSNQINFNSVAFEGADQTINLDTGTRNCLFSGCRFEFTGTSTFTTAASSYGIDVIGGLMSSATTITDNGVGNHIMIADFEMKLANRTNATKAMTISRSGSGMTSSLPALTIEDTYSSSGTPTTLKLVNPRGAGLLIDGGTSTTQYFSVSTLGEITTSGGFTLTGNITDNGQASRIWSLARNTTANTAGATLTITPGGATVGATNKASGPLILSGGTSTGTGTSSVQIYTTPVGSTGTADNTPAATFGFFRVSSANNAVMTIGDVSGTGVVNGINFGGAVAYNILHRRHTTANTAGNSLTIQSGGATSGATDKNGGNLIQKSGVSTGTGTSQFIVQTPTPGSTGTSDNTFADRLTVDSTGATFAGNITTPSIKITTGAGAGKVLTSDADGDATWETPAAGGGGVWTAMPGTPTRVSNTTFTVTGDVTAYVAKGMVIKWTESSTVRCAMVSIPSTYSAPDTTITIVGDTLASIDASSLKYAIGCEQYTARFAVAGGIGATGSDVANAYYATEPMRVIAADLQVGTAGTTNSTTIDVNKGGTTMFTTKPTLASTVATSPTPFTADSATSLALADKVTIDIDAVQTTVAQDLYVQLYLFPTRILSLT